MMMMMMMMSGFVEILTSHLYFIGWDRSFDPYMGPGNVSAFYLDWQISTVVPLTLLVRWQKGIQPVQEPTAVFRKAAVLADPFRPGVYAEKTGW